MGQEQSQNYGQNYDKIMEQYNIVQQGRYDINYNGKVDLLINKITKQQIVLKEVIIVNSLQKNKSLEHFEKRRKIQHPNLVNFYGLTNYQKQQNLSCQDQTEICGTGKKNYLQIEYVNRTLLDEIQQRTVQNQVYQENEIWDFLKNVISVLAYMQDLKLQHADLRPQKIFVIKNQNNQKINTTYKIAEKGLITSQTSFSIILGQQQDLCIDKKQQDTKHIYLSPQLVQSLIVHDWIPNQNQHKSDVFSLGMTVLHMIYLKEMDDIYDYSENQMEKAKIQQYTSFLKTKYSDRLYQIIEQMLLYSENKRPDFKELQIQFKNELGIQNKDISQDNNQITTNISSNSNISPKSKQVFEYSSNYKQQQFQYTNNQSPEHSTKPHSQRNSTIQQQNKSGNQQSEKAQKQKIGSPKNFNLPQNMYFSPPKTKQNQNSYNSPVISQINSNKNQFQNNQNTINNNNSVKKYTYNNKGNNEQFRSRQNGSLEKNKGSQNFNMKFNSSNKISTNKNQFSPQKIFQNSNNIIQTNNNLSRTNILSQTNSQRSINNNIQFNNNKYTCKNQQSNSNNNLIDLDSNFTPNKSLYSQEQLEEQELRRQIQEMYKEQQEKKNNKNQNNNNNGNDSMFSTNRNFGNNNSSSIVHNYNQAKLKLNSGSKRVSIKGNIKNNNIQLFNVSDNSGQSSPAVKFKNQKIQQQDQIIQKQYVQQVFPNGSKYEGEIYNNMRNGQGKFHFADGGLYIGDWKDNQMHGTGTLYYKNGQKAYEGEWFKDTFNGNATLWNENPEVFQGEFNYKNFEEVENKWLKYTGDFQTDSKQGLGILYLTNNDRFQGNFKADCIEGFGTYYFAKGGCIQGIWKNNILQQIQQQNNYNNNFNNNNNQNEIQYNRNNSQKQIINNNQNNFNYKNKNNNNIINISSNRNDQSSNANAEFVRFHVNNIKNYI